MNKTMILLIGSFFSSIVIADTCPTVKEVKSTPLKEWKICDSEDGKPLDAKRAKAFKQNIEAFALAEWENENNLRSEIHCYYRDKHGSAMEAYLSKENLSPGKSTKKFWYGVTGSLQCAAGMNQCGFQSTLQPTQLAKR